MATLCQLAPPEALTTEQSFEGTALGDQIVFTTQLLKGDTEAGHQGGSAL